MPETVPFTIDVVSDVVCPWCFIGKRHLARALASLADVPGFAPLVRWHPFQLNPDLPAEGVDRASYLEAKFGGPARAAEIYARVTEAGRGAGIAFAFDRIARQPNTQDAHRLIAWAQADHDAEALVESLFRAYFEDGRFVGDADVLVSLAQDAGLDADAARAMLQSDWGRTEIARADRRARSLGITGVPFFIFGERVGLSGAHPPETMVAAITQARTMPSAA